MTGLRLDPRLGRVALKNSAGKNQLAMPLAVCADHALARLRETGIAGRVDAVLDRYHGPLSQDEDPQAAAKRYGELLARDLGLGAAELAAFGPHEQPFNFHRALGAYLIERLPAEGSWWRSERKWTRVYASPASDAVIEQFPTYARQHVVPWTEARRVVLDRFRWLDLVGVAARYAARVSGREPAAELRNACEARGVQRAASSDVAALAEELPRLFSAPLPGPEAPETIGSDRRQYYVHLRGSRLHWSVREGDERVEGGRPMDVIEVPRIGRLRGWVGFDSGDAPPLLNAVVQEYGLREQLPWIADAVEAL